MNCPHYLAQSVRFGTPEGAYSVVTDREHFDSQITLADHEAQIVVTYFGYENIHIGNVNSNKKLASKTFSLYPSGENISLNVVYPKPNKSELRLYISAKAGFKPVGGDIWFVFVKDNKIWIGSMPEPEWRYDSGGLKQDESDEIYQHVIQDQNEIRIAQLKGKDVFVRDRRIALERMELAGFTCEYDSEHRLFISRFSRRPYLEAHHLIPISLQKQFPHSLDNIHNVFCLCPYCHRAIHHAEEHIARKMLSKLAEKRVVLESYSLTLSDLFGLYAVEEID